MLLVLAAVNVDALIGSGDDVTAAVHVVAEAEHFMAVVTASDVVFVTVVAAVAQLIVDQIFQVASSI